VSLSTSDLVIREALRFPDDLTARLYEQSKRGQWNIDRDISWKSMDVSAVAKPVRLAMSEIYTQVQYGEMIALIGAARLVEMSSQPWVKLMAALQVADEARHVEFFARLISELGEPSPVCEQLQCFAEEVGYLNSVEEVLLATQVVLESAAQAMFNAGFELGRARLAGAVRLPGHDAAAAVLSTLAQYIGRDESRHIAFGVTYLRRHAVEVGGRAASELTASAERWRDLLRGCMRGLDRPLRAIGLSSRALVERMNLADHNHLRQIGLASREGAAQP
jgi:hypothetical protein